MNRRTFVKGVAAGVASLASSAAAKGFTTEQALSPTGAPPREKPIVIDAHCHVYGFNKRDQFPRAVGEQLLGTMGLAEHPIRHWRYRDRMVTADSMYEEPSLLIEDMDRAGVDKAIILGMNIKTYNARTPAEDIAQVVAKWPNRLIGFHSVDVTGGTEAVKDMVRAVKELGLSGVKLFPVYNHVAPDHPRIYPIYQRAEELEIPVIVHAGFTPGADFKVRNARPFGLDEVAEYFPNLKLIIAHTGQQVSLETVTMMRNHRNMYGDFALWHLFPPYEHLVRTLVWAKSLGLIERLLWATDWPMVDPQGDLERFRSIPLYSRQHDMKPYIEDEDIDQILGVNAARLLGIQA